MLLPEVYGRSTCTCMSICRWTNYKEVVLLNCLTRLLKESKMGLYLMGGMTNTSDHVDLQVTAIIQCVCVCVYMMYMYMPLC